ncbi:hypothetical protein Spa11_10680 [Botrimarina mediterranea]|uniref:Uncharacterized protein n=1 Tax=Botrimarina mediterranea TaxID=2528022 RepID=A0A518K512_9BACT|nr:hypothetical protein Spa11_10680 [Botrimarina mediterranea]
MGPEWGVAKPRRRGRSLVTTSSTFASGSPCSRSATSRMAPAGGLGLPVRSLAPGRRTGRLSPACEWSLETVDTIPPDLADTTNIRLKYYGRQNMRTGCRPMPMALNDECASRRERH